MSDNKQMKRAEVDQTTSLTDSVEKANKEDPTRFYKVVNIRPGRMEGLKSLNYREEDASLVTSTLQTSAIANQVEMGIYKGSQKAVVVSCPRHEWEARQAKIKKEQEALLDESIDVNTYDGQEQPKGY